MPLIVEEAKPPKPLVSSHSRREAASRLRQMSSPNRIMGAVSPFRHLAVHFNRALGCSQRFIKFGIAFEAVDGMRKQSAEPSGKLRLGLRHVPDTRFEMLASGIHGADHDFISENEFQVDAIGRHLK